jgi:hypothetical protein
MSDTIVFTFKRKPNKYDRRINKQSKTFIWTLFQNDVESDFKIFNYNITDYPIYGIYCDNNPDKKLNKVFLKTNSITEAKTLLVEFYVLNVLKYLSKTND